MRMSIFGVTLVSLMLYLLNISAMAQNGDAILAKIDSVANAFQDMTAIEKMTLIDKNGSRKQRDVKIYQKGSELRLVRFMSPADVRGVGFLRLAEDRLYLYLPAFRKVRRIASSIKNENFMGTDFSYEDMSRNKYGKDYYAKLIETTENQYVLELTPRAGADVTYDRLVVFADKFNFVERKVEFYNSAGKLQKILTIDNVEQIDDYWFGRRMEMQTVKDGHRTVLDLSEVRFDQGLPDNIFTERNLKKPER